ncbi:sigma-70 family RNA polymerase sigma factor [Clostridium sp.]|uniref:sigma-70 family RNA polymerase sigma factor n=1 Tax=Clostridium sp. TaxID=1506 RepID=UPI003464A928
MNSYKKVEAMLYNYKKTKIEIKNMLLDIEDIENSYRGMGAIEYSDMPKAHNINSSVELEVIKKEEEILRLKTKIRSKEIEIEKINNILESLDERDRNIIEEYYIKKNQLKNISKHINLEESYLSSYKSKLIKEISSIMFIKEVS